MPTPEEATVVPVIVTFSLKFDVEIMEDSQCKSATPWKFITKEQSHGILS